MRDPDIGEILVQPDELRSACASSAQDHRGLRRPRPAARRRAQGRGLLPGRPHAPDRRSRARSTSWPSPPTARRPTRAASCGSSRTSTRRSRAAHVLIVEDIVDSGLTLQYLLRNLGARNPASLEVCALLTKPDAAQGRAADPLHVGFEIPDRFAIGYGLDHAERYRNLPYVAALAMEEGAGADSSVWPEPRESAGMRRPYTGLTRLWPCFATYLATGQRARTPLVRLPPCRSHHARRWRRRSFPMSRFFKSAAFPILIVVVLAFFAQRLISPGDAGATPVVRRLHPAASAR